MDAISRLRCGNCVSCLSHNELNSLPKDLPRDLAQLQTLHLQQNRLSCLPEDIASFAKLEDLVNC